MLFPAQMQFERISSTNNILLERESLCCVWVPAVISIWFNRPHKNNGTHTHIKYVSCSLADDFPHCAPLEPMNAATIDCIHFCICHSIFARFMAFLFSISRVQSHTELHCRDAVYTQNTHTHSHSHKEELAIVVALWCGANLNFYFCCRKTAQFRWSIYPHDFVVHSAWLILGLVGSVHGHHRHHQLQQQQPTGADQLKYETSIPLLFSLNIALLYMSQQCLCSFGLSARLRALLCV